MLPSKSGHGTNDGGRATRRLRRALEEAWKESKGSDGGSDATSAQDLPTRSDSVVNNGPVAARSLSGPLLGSQTCAAAGSPASCAFDGRA